MSKIYALNNDYTQYQDLKLGLRDIVRLTPDHIPLDDVLHFSYRNTHLMSFWLTPETKFSKNIGFENATIPDLSHWHRGTLVLSPRAFRLLRERLEKTGELLPVIVGTDTFYIYNCFVFGKEDEKKTKFSYLDDGRPFELLELVFTPETSDKLLFKSKLENCVTLFCNDQFKQIIEEYKLTGLDLDSVLLKSF